MIYYAWIENNNILSMSSWQCETTSITNIEVSEELFKDYCKTPNKYMYSNNEVVINPNYEQEQAQKRQHEFEKDFFNTSLGWIRRKVSMKTGEIKDFLTDLLPTISMAVSQGQTVNIITYTPPDFYQEVVDWESLQTIKVVTPEFIQECFNQVNKDFTGI